MPKTLKTIGKQVELTQLILAVAQNEEVKNPLAAYGFDETEYDHGQTLLDEAIAEMAVNTETRNERKKAVRDFEEAALAAKRCFWKFALIAKQIMPPEMVENLKISGRRKVSFMGWSEEARNFYSTVLREGSEPARQILNRVGITRAHLEMGRQMLNDLRPLFSEKANQKGLAKCAVGKKNHALKRLAKWNSNFLFFARMAFKNNPKHLVRFGYVVATVPLQTDLERDTKGDRPVLNGPVLNAKENREGPEAAPGTIWKHQIPLHRPEDFGSEYQTTWDTKSPALKWKTKSTPKQEQLQ